MNMAPMRLTNRSRVNLIHKLQLLFTTENGLLPDTVHCEPANMTSLNCSPLQSLPASPWKSALCNEWYHIHQWCPAEDTQNFPPLSECKNRWSAPQGRERSDWICWSSNICWQINMITVANVVSLTSTCWATNHWRREGTSQTLPSGDAGRAWERG